MTRQEAINRIVAVWFGYDQEFCGSPNDTADSQREMREALHVLGVTDEEIDS